MKNNKFNFHKAKFSPIKRPTSSTALTSASAIKNKKINYSERKDKVRDANWLNNYNYNFIAKTTDNKERDYESNTSVNTNKSKQSNRQLSRKSMSPKTPYVSNSEKSLNACIQSAGIEYDMSEVLFNVNDDYRTLINKNAKLSNMILQSSTKLKEREEEYKAEKAGILEELDRIIGNYKIYAEGYRKYQTLEEQFYNLNKDYQHNYNVMIAYQKSLKTFLKDYIDLLKTISNCLNSKYSNIKNPLQVLFDFKEQILDNLLKYKETVDILNFSEIYKEYNEIVEQRLTYKPNSGTVTEATVTSHSPQGVKFPGLNQGAYIKPSYSTQNTHSDKKEKDVYNYPFQIKTMTNSRSSNNLKSAQPKRSNENLMNTPNKNKKTEVNIQNITGVCIGSNTNNTTRNEIKDLSESINSNLDKINNTGLASNITNLLNISRESLNISNISNVFEKNKGENFGINSGNRYCEELNEQTPQFYNNQY